MKRSEIIRFLILRTIGNFLLLFAIFGVFATFGPALYYEVQFRTLQMRGVQFRVSDERTPVTRESSSNSEVRGPTSVSFADILAGPKEQVLIPFDPFFNILIPKIGANARVFSNIDSGNQDEFLPYLQAGVAHAKGTVFPGMEGNTYLFAHSADNFWNVGRYNAAFYLLKDLTVGDDIIIFFENRRYNYKVSEIQVVDAEEVSFLVNAQQRAGQKLILQTCWPPGTTWKRLVVFAKPV